MGEEDEEQRRQRRLEEALEVKSLRRIISAYLNYPEAAEEDVKRYEASFRKLSPAHKALLSHYPSKFRRLRRSQQDVETEDSYKSKISGCHADSKNGKETDQSCCNEIVDSNGNVSSSPREWLDPSFQLNVPLADIDKVRCIIRNVVRDWAAEGQKERDQCYKPILEELDALFPNRSKESTQTAGEWRIHPWIHSNCNSLSDSDQLRPVSIPDIHPASAGITEGFSMCGGDFVEVYNDPSQIGVWDAVVTCFFIDTAHNIVEYIEIISKILKDGGVWINLGPLLYHFADMYGQEDEMSIELSLEDVKKVSVHYGFEFEKEKTIETTYTTNPRSMMQNRYYAAFWTARKKSATVEHGTS